MTVDYNVEIKNKITTIKKSRQTTPHYKAAHKKQTLQNKKSNIFRESWHHCNVQWKFHWDKCQFPLPTTTSVTVSLNSYVFLSLGETLLQPQAEESYCIAGNIIDRQDHNGGNGLGCQPDISYTITATDRHAVFNRQGYSGFGESDVAGTQCARQHKDATDLISTYQEVVGALCSGDYKGPSSQYVSQDKCIIGEQSVFGQSQFGNYAEGCTTLRAQGGDNGGGSENLVAISSPTSRKLIRRLTPLECERLQGFPDGWTDIPGASDSARYKALGNSVAIPCVDFVLRGIAYFLRKFKEEQEE